MEPSSIELWVLTGLYLGVNLLAFLIMAFDKKRAIQEKRRISEGDLFLLSICFGALGVLLGMKFSRHKTRKIKFILGIPLALTQNIATLYLFFKIFSL